MAWAKARRQGENLSGPSHPSVAFGVSCALAELNDELPLEAEYRAVPLCTGDPDELFASWRRCPVKR